MAWHNYPSYFRFLKSKLRHWRSLLNIASRAPTNRSGPSAGGFIDAVFPRRELTGSGRIHTEAQDIGRKSCRGEPRQHYALTLREWCANLVEHWDEAVEEVGVAHARCGALHGRIASWDSPKRMSFSCTRFWRQS